MDLLMIFLIGLLFVMTVLIVWGSFKFWQLFNAMNDVIIKTITNTAYVEKNKIFIDTLTKFGNNDRTRKDKEFSELKTLVKQLESDLKISKNLVDNLRKER